MVFVLLVAIMAGCWAFARSPRFQNAGRIGILAALVGIAYIVWNEQDVTDRSLSLFLVPLAIGIPVGCISLALRLPSRRWARFAAFLTWLTLLTPMVMAFGILHAQQAGRQSLEAMLAGNEAPRITSFEVSSPGKRAVCVAPKVLEYIERQLRSPVSTEPVMGGPTLTVRLNFADETVYEGTSTWTKQGFATREGEFLTHYVRFALPLPDGISQLLEFVHAPQPAGTIFRIQ